MATNKPKPQGAKDALQDEEQLEKALHRLNQLHLQLRRLRSALPRMLAPLNAKHASPQALFSTFMQSVDGANREISAFQQAVMMMESEGIFAKAHESQQKNPKGIKQWRARDDPDWADQDGDRKRPRHS
ncbi:hypothetical protein VTK56DRAFT_8494 [Thermocarpiscus australiensis]